MTVEHLSVCTGELTVRAAEDDVGLHDTVIARWKREREGTSELPSWSARRLVEASLHCYIHIARM